MYGYIKGKVTKICPKYIICDNNGIGYLIIVGNPYSYKLNEDYTIYTYQAVRDDGIELYGFIHEDEKELFLKLISVNGIGPKSALSIVASGSVKEIINAIEARNDRYLRKFPGIGQKASQQIILDLRGKLDFESKANNTTNELNDALISLGYKQKDVDKVCKKLDMSLPIETLIKEALKLLTRMWLYG